MNILLIENQPHVIKKLPQFNPNYIANSLEAWRKTWSVANPRHKIFFNEKNGNAELKKNITQGFSLECFIYVGAIIHDFVNIDGINNTLKNFKHFEESIPTIFELVSANHLSRSHGRREAPRGRARDRCAWTGEATSLPISFP